MVRDQYLQSFGLYPRLCSLWEFPLWEKEDLICLIPHEVLDGVEFGQSPVEVSGLPHAPVGDSGLGTVSAQLMAPRGAGLVSLPKLGSSRNNLVDKERVLELCSSEEGIEWPCR